MKANKDFEFVAARGYCNTMTGYRRSRLLILVLALILGLGASLSSAQAAQISETHADCLFCVDDGNNMDVAACMFLCANSGVAVVAVLDIAVDPPAALVGGSPEFRASSRIGRPDPYPPRI
jgi:hypothetical protein